MAEQFQNFYVTKLREACDATATTIYVDTVPAITEGTLVLEYANSTKHEIIHFTGVSGYGLTGCTRGLEGTTAQSHSAGTDVRQNLTAGIIDKIINGVITTENIANSAVTTAKINDGAVTADKIDFTTLSGNYSTTEKDTGFTWIDGKNIYKKTFSFGTLPNTNSKYLNVSIPDLNQIVKMEVLENSINNKTSHMIDGCYGSSTNNKLFENFFFQEVDGVYRLACSTGNDRSEFEVFITLYYTKTS